jgi:hypothetical protein
MSPPLLEEVFDRCSDRSRQRRRPRLDLTGVLWGFAALPAGAPLMRPAMATFWYWLVAVLGVSM